MWDCVARNGRASNFVSPASSQLARWDIGVVPSNAEWSDGADVRAVVEKNRAADEAVWGELG